jgi:hypothetical protein
MNDSATATIKQFVRPKTGKGIQIGVRCPLAVLDEIDRWAAAQPDKPKRAEAILRLVQEALAGTADKQPATLSNSTADAPNAEVPSPPTVQTPMAPEPPPQSETTQHLGVEVEQTTREVRWTPRVIEAGPLPAPTGQALSAVTSLRALGVATRKARPPTKPIEDSKPYEMPEDIEAFDEFWKRAEQRLRRRLNYEEAVVSYNRYRQGIAECD